MGFTSPDYRALTSRARPLQRVYFRAQRFLNRRPFLAKAMPTATGFAFGDFLTQYFNRDEQKPFLYDHTKALKMALIGATIVTPINMQFLRTLDLTIFAAAPNLPLNLGIKFTLEQVVGCMFWQVAYVSICEKYRAGAHRMYAKLTSPETTMPTLAPSS